MKVLEFSERDKSRERLRLSRISERNKNRNKRKGVLNLVIKD